MNQKKVEEILRGVKESYHSIAHDFTRSRMNQRWSRIEDYVKKNIRPGEHVLDAGCGGARLLVPLSELSVPLEYTGYDNSQSLLSAAMDQFGVQCGKVKIWWQQGDLFSLPFPDQSFDHIFAIASLHHIPSLSLRKKVISEFSRVLKKDGSLCMTNWFFWHVEAFRKYTLFVQLFSNLMKGYDWGDFLIPWKDRDRNTIVNRYYHGFTFSEVEKLLGPSHWKVLENTVFYPSVGQRSVARSIFTVAQKIF